MPLTLALLNISDIDYSKPLSSIGEKFAYGGQMILIGLGIVFSVLLILWGSLELFRVLFYSLPKTEGFQSFRAKLSNAVSRILGKKKAASKEPAAPAPAPTSAPVAVSTATATDDAELVAVLAAAIAAASEDAPAGSFRVVSFRRV